MSVACTYTTYNVGPEMIAFLKKRRDQKKREGSEGGKEDMDISEPVSTAKDVRKVKNSDCHETDRDEKDKSVESLGRSVPGKWLHMDVVEKEKMEWMIDVPLYRQDSSNKQEEQREVRFSLEGLVVPRSVVLPAHLGLHHHGDEPQVSHATVYTCACTHLHGNVSWDRAYIVLIIHMQTI